MPVKASTLITGFGPQDCTRRVEIVLATTDSKDKFSGWITEHFRNCARSGSVLAMISASVTRILKRCSLELSDDDEESLLLLSIDAKLFVESDAGCMVL